MAGSKNEMRLLVASYPGDICVQTSVLLTQHSLCTGWHAVDRALLDFLTMETIDSSYLCFTYYHE